MNNISLVGYTGFVGSNLCKSYSFQNLYNSKNITQAYGSEPDVLLYAGVTGLKHRANKFPLEDRKVIDNAVENIKKIAPKKLVLISTVDVYEKPDGLTELDEPNSESNFPYGYHRKCLENWVKNNVKNFLIVRLPGIYGYNLKKNFIYDLIEPIPQLLTADLIEKLSKKQPQILAYYYPIDDGYWKIKKTSPELHKKLKILFDDIGFNSLCFTDPMGLFQYYNLTYLWEHINIAIKAGLNILNLATEPFTAKELYHEFFNNEWENSKFLDHAHYNFKTIHFELFGGSQGYIFSKTMVINDIKKFVMQRRLSNGLQHITPRL